MLSKSWRHIYRLIPDKILYLVIYFVLKRSLSICHIIQGHFQQVLIDLGFHFQNKIHFHKYFVFYLLTNVYTKNNNRNFCLFVYLQSYNDKSKFSSLQTVPPNQNTWCVNEPFFCKMLAYRVLALIFLYTLKKIPWKNYVKFWKWNLKRTSQSAKIRFRENQI